MAINVASYVGHNTLRRQVMQEDYKRPATDAEIDTMKQLLRREMASGALGLSSGLEYDPGIFSEPSEVLALAQEAANLGGRYSSHIRSEDRHFWEAIEEIIQLGQAT
ncbi:MAG TPA: aminoacylase, partial [Candidatus Latescibacteria bacterium]|nr:aminoacylase [Candidatus Latescibacterota bacterium]